jgi:integrase
MASIRRRGERWHVQIRRKDHPPICKAFGHRKDAEAWVRDTERTLDRGEELAAPTAPACIGELLSRYAQSVSPNKRGGEIEVIRLAAMARQSIGKVMASRLTTASLATWRDERLRVVAPATVARELGLLRRVMVTATHEWAVRVPLAAFEYVSKPKQPPGRVRRLPADAAAALLQACGESMNPFLRPAVVVALETGMRRGEVVALTWTDVDVDTGLIQVRETKNGHGRLIPMTALAKREFVGLSGLGRNRPFDTTGSALHQAFEHARERARKALQARPGAEQGVDHRRRADALAGFRLHDLRHEAISRFFEKGLTMVEAAEVSGHRTLAMLKRYAHADVCRIADKLAADDLSSAIA